jgi:hypothetical protein
MLLSAEAPAALAKSRDVRPFVEDGWFGTALWSRCREDDETALPGWTVPFDREVRVGGLGLFGFPLRLGFFQVFAAFGALGECAPRRFGPAATLAHMVERGLIRFAARLSGARTKELEVRVADDRS